jgi:hypothetical protein
MSQAGLARIAFKALMNEVTQVTASQGRKEYKLVTHLILRRSTSMAAVVSSHAKVSKN